MRESVNMKTIIALSEEFADRPAVQLNAIGHLSQSIGFQIAQLGIGRFTPYEDADGIVLPPISWWPVIILSGRPQKVMQVWDSLRFSSFPKAVFTETMIAGGSAKQLAATRSVKLGDSKFVAIAAFGEAETLQGITKRLSLWQNPSK